MFGIRRRVAAASAANRRQFVNEQLEAALAEQRRCIRLAADTMSSAGYRDDDDPEPPQEVCAMAARARHAHDQVDAYLLELAGLLKGPRL